MMILSEDYKFEKLSINDGLSQSTVYSIIQDKNDFVWICTQQGLNRFDGYNFKVYTNDPLNIDTIANNYLCASYKDSDGKIWFGSLDGNFANYNEKKDCFSNFRIPSEDIQSIIKSYVYAMTEYSASEIFISFANIGLFSYNKIQDEYKQFDSNLFGADFNFKNILSLFHDEHGFTWLGTLNDGLIKIDFKKNTFLQFKNNPNDETSVSSNRIKFIFQDSRKIFWIGTSNGLNRFDPDRNIFRRYLHNTGSDKKFNLSCISEDKNNNLWVGTLNAGLIKFNAEKNDHYLINSDPGNPDSLSSDVIRSLYSDNSNVLWIGNFNDGINKLDCERHKFYNLNNLVSGKRDTYNLSIFSILKVSGNNIFLGSDFEGLFNINSENGNIENYLLKNDKIIEQTILCLLEDEFNDIWIGTHKQGLYKFNVLSKEYENFIYSNSINENSILALCRFNHNSNDFLWVGTLTNGLFRFDKNKKEFTKYSSLKNFNQTLAGNGIKCLLLDSSGILWIGTDTGGLNSLDFENGIIKHYLTDKNDTDSISDNYIVSLCEDHNGNIFAGTMNGGLNLFIKADQRFKRFITESKLSDNTIRGILKDDEFNLWLSTNNGLVKFNPVKNIIRYYDVKDGLQSKEFNDGAYYKDKEGIFYFGGVNGFNFFKPEEIKDNTYVPNIAITDFQIFNHSVVNSPDNPFLKNSITETKEINLTYRESVFSFEFAALIYNNPQKNQYAYMMEGFDKEWIYCGARRFVTYTSLDHGEYTFRVKGSNNDGIWNEEGASVKISITPPFWKTWWFKSLGLLSVAGATGLTYHQRLMKVEKEKLQQEDFSRKLLSSQEEERKKIATELHHTIAHDVLVTKNKIAIGLKNTDDSDKVKNILDEISDLASNTLKDVRSISHALHPHQLESLGLTKAVRSIINTVAKSTEIKLTASIDNIDNLFSKDLEINIFRIIQECFNNIIKHSAATEVKLETFKKGHYVNIVISDNGVGFKIDKKAEAGMGVSETEERIKLYGGHYKIDSEPGKGTVLTIIIPVNKI